MKKMERLFALPLFLLICMALSVPASASAYKTVPVSTSCEEADRTVRGAIFSSVYNTSSGNFSLSVEKDGATKTITDAATGGTVISNGSVVYYVSKKSGRYVLYKADLNKGTVKRIGKLTSRGHYGADLLGLYKNTILYIVDSPEGSLAAFDLKSKKARTIHVGEAFTQGTQHGKYFVLADGTGAGYSYLGVYNAANGTFRRIAKLPKEPLIWYSTSKYVYFAELKSGNTFSGKPYTICVRRYRYATKKTKTLIRSLKVKYVTDISSKKLTYVTAGGKTKTKKW